MSAKEQRAFRQQLDRGARESHKAAVRSVEQRAATQRVQCAEELGQVREAVNADVWKAKLAAQAAAATLKTKRTEGRARVQQKAANCRGEQRAILAERERVKEGGGKVGLVARGAPVKQASTAERRTEARDEVRHNLPPELVPLWEEIGASFQARFEKQDKGRSTLTEAFIEATESDPDAALAAQERLARRARPSRREEQAEREEKCNRARREAQAAVARGEADPRQLDWITRFCKTRAPRHMEVPF